MKISIEINNNTYHINTREFFDLSIPIVGGSNNVNAWGVALPEIKPLKVGDWTAKVSEGGSVNCNNVFFNSHAHCTHTESYGHIVSDFYPVSQAIQEHFFLCRVCSILPESQDLDQRISDIHLKSALHGFKGNALVIRTHQQPKPTYDYSQQNPPFLTEMAAKYLSDFGIDHLLIDLPSIDKEQDGGALKAHHAFWNIPENPRKTATITELIQVSPLIKDGDYLLNLQLAPLENDAAPSRPLLFKLNLNGFRTHH